MKTLQISKLFSETQIACRKPMENGLGPISSPDVEHPNYHLWENGNQRVPLAMESIQRFTHRFLPITFNQKCFKPISRTPILTRPVGGPRQPVFRPIIVAPRRNHNSGLATRAGWFLGMGEKKIALPDTVKAGDPVLHEPAQEIQPEEIGSERIQKIIDDMVKVMRKAPGVGLAAPQIGIPLRVSNCNVPASLIFE